MSGLQRTPDAYSDAERGWGWVEERLGDQDVAVMKDYSEDIDSLLVLDGLFSAVVTGFIVLSVAMLQKDTGQTAADMLSTISGQLASMSNTPYSNSTTANPAVSSQPFEPGSAARWINILWFLSLTFSLASAVFGILVKQWIREYLNWRSPTSDSRKNVLVRQIRFEAWKQWRTPIIISSIPALLELAVILFVGGMTIYLWTLDLVVALVVTVFVGLFIVLVAVFTLMPVMLKRCPYKSPTAWAFVFLWRLISRCCNLLAAQCFRRSRERDNASSHPYNAHFDKLHTLSHSDDDDTWRGRDLRGAEFVKLQDPHHRIMDARYVLLQELATEARGALDGSTPPAPTSSLQENGSTQLHVPQTSQPLSFPESYPTFSEPLPPTPDPSGHSSENHQQFSSYSQLNSGDTPDMDSDLIPLITFDKTDATSRARSSKAPSSILATSSTSLLPTPPQDLLHNPSQAQAEVPQAHVLTEQTDYSLGLDSCLTSGVVDTYALVLGESDLLFKALVIVGTQSRGVGDLSHLEECIRSIQPALHCADYYSSLSKSIQLAELVIDGGFRNISVWYMLSRVNAIGPGYMGSFLRHPCIARMQPPDSSVSTYIRSILRRRILQDQPLSQLPYTFVPPLSAEDMSDRAVESIETPESRSVSLIMSFVLAESFRTGVAEALHPIIINRAQNDPAVLVVHCRLEELLEALGCVAFSLDTGLPQARAGRWKCAELLIKVFNSIVQHKDKSLFDSLFASLRYKIFMLLSASPYTIQFVRNCLLIRQRSIAETRPSAAEDFAVAMQMSLDDPQITPEDLTIFAQVISNAMALIDRLSADEVRLLLEKAECGLRVASGRGWTSSICRLHDTWTQQLKEKTVPLGSSSPVPIVLSAFRRAPRPLLRLMLDLESVHESISPTSSNPAGVLAALAYLHAPHNAESFSEDDLATYNVLMRYSLSMPPAASNEWLALFFRIANRWLLGLRQEHSKAGTQNINQSTSSNSAHTVKSGLEKLNMVVAQAINMRWSDASGSKMRLLWLYGMVRTTTDTSGAARSQAFIEALYEVAPQAMQGLASSLKGGSDQKVFEDADEIALIADFCAAVDILIKPSP